MYKMERFYRKKGRASELLGKENKELLRGAADVDSSLSAVRVTPPWQRKRSCGPRVNCSKETSPRDSETEILLHFHKYKISLPASPHKQLN